MTHLEVWWDVLHPLASAHHIRVHVQRAKQRLATGPLRADDQKIALHRTAHLHPEADWQGVLSR